MSSNFPDPRAGFDPRTIELLRNFQQTKTKGKEISRTTSKSAWGSRSDRRSTFSGSYGDNTKQQTRVFYTSNSKGGSKSKLFAHTAAGYIAPQDVFQPPVNMNRQYANGIAKGIGNRKNSSRGVAEQSTNGKYNSKMISQRAVGNNTKAGFADKRSGLSLNSGASSTSNSSTRRRPMSAMTSRQHFRKVEKELELEQKKNFQINGKTARGQSHSNKNSSKTNSHSSFLVLTDDDHDEKDSFKSDKSVKGMASNPSNQQELDLQGQLHHPHPDDFIPPEDGVIFADSPDCPGVPIVYRTAQARKKNSERLNLDRRQLPVCPIVEGEQNLRLLNFQHNCIKHISNLQNLPNLIFLDLYNNKISEICNLDIVPTLRVLMLGKNKIEKIKNLNNLLKLDVLDLHSNAIKTISDLEGLQRLRVLNLAGNKITTVRGISDLTALKELNLRRNEIDTVLEVDRLHHLERLFLTNNRIEKFDAITSVFRSRSLRELALDGNPLQKSKSCDYRCLVIQRLANLKQLDKKAITIDERNSSGSTGVSKRRFANNSVPDRQRENAISCAEREWTSANKSYSDKNCGTDECSLQTWLSKTDAMCHQNKSRRPSHTENDDLLSKGYAEEGISGDTHRLYIYGPDFRALNDQKFHKSISEVMIQYAQIEKVIKEALPKLELLSKTHHLTLSHNNVNSLRELGFFCRNLPDNIKSLRIKENQVVTLKLYRPWVIFNVAHLYALDGKPISDSERTSAERIFQPIFKISPFTNHKEGFEDLNTKAKYNIRKIVNKITEGALLRNSISKGVHEEWPKIVRATCGAESVISDL